MSDDEKPIIIKKVKKGGHGHHGGAWKVAYADFVTAMMAFFLLLWLLNVTTDEQKALISSYFSPSDPRIADSISGSGGLLGGLTMSQSGAMTSDVNPVMEQPATPTDEQGRGKDEVDIEELAEEELKHELERREEERFEGLADEIKQAMSETPELQALAENLLIDQTPEGLRIQIIDQKGRPMFTLGSADPLPKTIKLLKLVTKVITKAPNMISVRGHTDSRPYGPDASYTNWELSSDRANASRRVMLAAKLPLKRIENVVGKAAREPLIVKDPYSPKNRRISIILLKESIVSGVHDDKKTSTSRKARKPKDIETQKNLKKREEGIIYFP